MSKKSKKQRQRQYIMKYSKKHTIPKNHKKMRKKNINSNDKIKTKFSKLQLKNLDKELLELHIIRTIALHEENQEVYANKTQIIIMILIELITKGNKEPLVIKLINKYLGKDIKLTSLKESVKDIYDTYHYPPSTSIAPGWVW